MPRPDTSEKPALIGPPPSTGPNSTRNLNAPYGLSRTIAGMSSSSPLRCPSAARVGGELADAEDHELRRLDRRDPDEADQPAVVEVVLRHRGAVAAHEVRLLRRGAQECAGAPLDVEEVLHGAADVAPQRLAVGLEHRPLGGL